LWLCALTLWLTAWPAQACRYNVRDLGFIELETETCQLLICASTNTTAATLAAWRRAAAEALQESNLRIEFVHPAQSEVIDRPLAELIATNRLPAAALVSPDGPVLSVLVGPSDPPLETIDDAAWRGLVDSPTRDEIVREASRRFGVILWLEGTDSAQNRAARSAITEAVAEIGQSLAALPKAITEPPAVVTLPVAALARERILLWSLRLTPEPTPEPRAAVIYGKARWIGPLMKGQEIAVGNLTRLFSIVGADCECGLDLAWTRGTSLPVRWTAAAHQATTKSLGFDPLDPLVQMEATRILDRFSSSIPNRPRPASTRSSAPTGSSSALPPLAPANPPPDIVAARASPLPPLEPSSPSWRMTWITVVSLVCLVAAGSAWLWSRRG